MKKYFFLLLILLAVVANSYAGDPGEDEDITIELEINGPSTNKTIRRAPMTLDIEAYYNPYYRMVTVTSETCIIASASLMQDGFEISHANSIPAILYVPESNGSYTIEIEGGTWNATGIIPE